MKLKAKKVPYSSTVGGGLMLLDEKGRAAFIVHFMGTTSGISKEQTAALTEAFTRWITKYGLEIPDA